MNSPVSKMNNPVSNATNDMINNYQNTTFIVDDNTLADNIKINRNITTSLYASLPEKVKITIEFAWDDNNQGSYLSVYETHLPYNNFLNHKLVNNENNIKNTYSDIYGILYNNFINGSDCIDYMSRTKTGPFTQGLIDRGYNMVDVCIGTYHIYKNGSEKNIDIKKCISFNSAFELYRDDINIIHWRQV